MQAYEAMLAHFGPRHWWPGDTPFEVMVGAILTQNTNWKNVEKAIANIKAADLLDPRALIKAGPARIAGLIRPAGYYNIKAARLLNFLRYYVERFGGDSRQMSRAKLPALHEELLAVKGIGKETCDSILLYALGKPVFVIDAYTKRILMRHSLCDEEATYDDLQELFTDALDEDVKLFNEYHALIVETGKSYCRKAPRCDACPLKSWNRPS
jgi:endonuclease-3 related protein